MTATATLATHLLVKVEPIVGGEATCFCGEPAVMVVTTDPDDEPGPACPAHAWEWIDLALGLGRELYGPKDA